MVLLETEIKLRLESSTNTCLSKLFGLGMTLTSEETEINVLFDTADEQLKAKGEILRVRYDSAHPSKHMITHKGPKVDSEYIKRFETELFTNSDPRPLLVAMGYSEVFYYKRTRHTYRYQNPALGGIATWDQILRVKSKTSADLLHTPWGVSFLELEGWDTWIDEVASKLGFTKDQYITKSYREIFEG